MPVHIEARRGAFTPRLSPLNSAAADRDSGNVPPSRQLCDLHVHREVKSPLGLPGAFINESYNMSFIHPLILISPCIPAMTPQGSDTASVDGGSDALSLAAFQFVGDYIGLDDPENQASEGRVGIRHTLDDIAGILRLDHTERSALRSRRVAGRTEPLHPLVRRLRLHVASRTVDPSRGSTTQSSQYIEDDADATPFDGFTRYLSTRLKQATEAREADQISHAA